MMLEIREHTIGPPHASFILVLIPFAQTWLTVGMKLP
jgi:hypothetical protein